MSSDSRDMENKAAGKYDDIINLPHHVSARRFPMSMHDRAAQFSSFKALTGLEDELQETARVTDAKLELSEEQKESLNRVLSEILREEHPVVTVTYFEKDAAKEGGKYITFTGTVKKYDDAARQLVFSDGKRIPAEDISKVEPESS